MDRKPGSWRWEGCCSKPHLLLSFLHHRLVLEVGQLGQPRGFLGLSPACAQLLFQKLPAEAGILGVIGPRSYMGLK